jgi:prevent-host-death family protein
MVIIVKKDIKMNTKWTVAEAKAKFSEVITQAELKGPQTITRNGRTAVVMVSYDEWERKTKRVGNLAEFFAASPLREAEISLERLPEKPGEIEL